MRRESQKEVLELFNRGMISQALASELLMATSDASPRESVAIIGVAAKVGPFGDYTALMQGLYAGVDAVGDVSEHVASLSLAYRIFRERIADGDDYVRRKPSTANGLR